MKNSILIVSLAFVTAAVSGISAPAFAGEAPQVLVRYDDINLASSEGARQLQARVTRAASTVCDTSDHDLGAIMAANNCKRAAIAGATPQVELALANARSGQIAQNGRVPAH